MTFQENNSQLSSDEDLEDETGSDFGSEDDPDKLWYDSVYMFFFIYR